MASRTLVSWTGLNDPANEPFFAPAAMRRKARHSPRNDRGYRTETGPSLAPRSPRNSRKRSLQGNETARMLPSLKCRWLGSCCCSSSISNLWVSTSRRSFTRHPGGLPRRRRPIAARACRDRVRRPVRACCCDVVMLGRRAASGPSPRPGRAADRTGRGRSAPGRAAGCRASVRRA
jgi:hypothetical protein